MYAYKVPVCFHCHTLYSNQKPWWTVENCTSYQFLHCTSVEATWSQLKFYTESKYCKFYWDLRFGWKCYTVVRSVLNFHCSSKPFVQSPPHLYDKRDHEQGRHEHSQFTLPQKSRQESHSHVVLLIFSPFHGPHIVVPIIAEWGSKQSSREHCSVHAPDVTMWDKSFDFLLPSWKQTLKTYGNFLVAFSRCSF